jgi:hypothetical protein
VSLTVKKGSRKVRKEIFFLRENTSVLFVFKCSLRSRKEIFKKSAMLFSVFNPPPKKPPLLNKKPPFLRKNQKHLLALNLNPNN